MNLAEPCPPPRRFRHQADDNMLTLDDPPAPGERCNSAMNLATFTMTCKVIP